jgi:hypothetical protein
MQQLAISAIASGAVMVLIVSLGLVLHRGEVRRPGHSRWVRASIVLAGAGLAIGVISRAGGQSATTHLVLYSETTTLLVAALMCALVGAGAAMRQRQRQ